MRDSDVSAEAPRAIYERRCTAFAARRDGLARRSQRLANWRLVAFFAAAAVLGWAIWSESLAIGAIALALFIAFALMVGAHRRVERERGRFAVLWEIDDEARRRLARDWADLPLRHTVRADPGHPYAVDLDLFGRASVLHLLETFATSMGERTLANWLASPARLEIIEERQASVTELAPLLDLRDDLQASVRLVGPRRPDPEPFLDWAEGEPWLRRQRILVWAARLLPLALWAAVLAQLSGLIGFQLWLPLLFINLAVTTLAVGRVQTILSQVSLQENAFRSYADAIALISETSFESSALQGLQRRLTANGISAPIHIRRLHTLTTLVVPASSMAYWVVQPLTFWDVHLLQAFERWQVAVGRHARDWLEALGEAEALAALAAVAHDEPAWTFPTFDLNACELTARGLGHPLLADESRVTNDVTVGPPGTFLLVTGSNMSGKSTLLRSIGVNVALAGAGGPVCAADLRLPPVELWTCMRVQDSLERGVSFFMAELQRLKQVVDGVAAARDDGTRLPLYLLDEILQGTNTAERQIAAHEVILTLLSLGAIGAVSTHDLTLADAPALRDASRAVHFQERIDETADGWSMTFDYRLRPGVATSTNALRLMQMVGLRSGLSGRSGEAERQACSSATSQST